MKVTYKLGHKLFSGQTVTKAGGVKMGILGLLNDLWEGTQD